MGSAIDHYFVASDGEDVTKTRQEHGPFVEGEDPDWNYPPELHDAEVDPLGGTPSDEFVFRVFYQDQEGGGGGATRSTCGLKSMGLPTI